jgi:hypothetical protein
MKQSPHTTDTNVNTHIVTPTKHTQNRTEESNQHLRYWHCNVTHDDGATELCPECLTNTFKQTFTNIYHDQQNKSSQVGYHTQLNCFMTPSRNIQQEHKNLNAVTRSRTKNASIAGSIPNTDSQQDNTQLDEYNNTDEHNQTDPARDSEAEMDYGMDQKHGNGDDDTNTQPTQILPGVENTQDEKIQDPTHIITHPRELPTQIPHNKPSHKI